MAVIGQHLTNGENKSGRIRYSGKSYGRKIATINLLNLWQVSTSRKGKWVLSYLDAFDVGKIRASPVDKRTTRMPRRLSQPVGILNGKARKKPSLQKWNYGRHLFPRKALTLFICRYSRNAGQYS